MAEIPPMIRTGEVIPKGVERKHTSNLVYQEARLSRVDVSFGQIQGVLEEQVGAQLPYALCERLGFDRQRWQLIYDRHSLPMLFIGGEVEEGQPLALDDAMGSVEIERLESTISDKVFAFNVRVAGVGQDSNGEKRVLAAAYNAYGRNAANHIDFSVTDAEFPRTNDAELRSTGALWEPIPSTSRSIYHTGGLITEAMVDATAETNLSANITVIKRTDGSTHHGTVLRIYAANEAGKKLHFGDRGSVSEKRGFSLSTSGEAHIVRFEPPVQAEGLATWSVDLPKSLVR